MTLHASLILNIQLGIIIVGFIVAAIAVQIKKYNMIAMQLIGCAIASVAAFWAAWAGVDQYFRATHHFAEKWLGMNQFFAGLIGATAVFLIVLAATGWPRRKAAS